jgi:hypothetical protein
MKKLSSLFNEFEIKSDSLVKIHGGKATGGCTEKQTEHCTGNECDGDTEEDDDVNTLVVSNSISRM